jgi:hypothetical protein
MEGESLRGRNLRYYHVVVSDSYHTIPALLTPACSASILEDRGLKATSIPAVLQGSVALIQSYIVFPSR